MTTAVREGTNFMHSDPRWRVPIELPGTFLSIDEVTAGDIVYTRRPRGYQRLAAIAGDTWRHVGLCVTIAGFPWLVEMGPIGFQGRPMTTIVTAYDTVAVQRLHQCQRGCRTAFVNQVCARMQHPATFHTRVELAGIGLASLARLSRVGVGPIAQLRQWLAGRDGFESRAICSTPIVDALDSLCERHRVVLDVTSAKRRSPAVEASGLTQFAMPDDVWRALQTTATPYWVRKDEHVPPPQQQIDLRPHAKEVTHMHLGT